MSTLTKHEYFSNTVCCCRGNSKLPPPENAVWREHTVRLPDGLPRAHRPPPVRVAVARRAVEDEGRVAVGRRREPRREKGEGAAADVVPGQMVDVALERIVIGEGGGGGVSFCGVSRINFGPYLDGIPSCSKISF